MHKFPVELKAMHKHPPDAQAMLERPAGTAVDPTNDFVEIPFRSQSSFYFKAHSANSYFLRKSLRTLADQAVSQAHQNGPSFFCVS